MYQISRSINRLVYSLLRGKLRISIPIGILLAFVLGFLPGYIEYSHRSSFNDSVPKVIPSPTINPSLVPLIKETIPLNTDQIFKNNYYSFEDRIDIDVLPQDEVVDIWLGGDVMLGRSVGYNMVRLKSFEYPFLKIADKLSQADLVAVNLENPIVDNCPITNDGMIFCSTPGTLAALTKGGIDIVNVANNHILNYGSSGLSNTLTKLDSQKIKHFGSIYQPLITEIRGTKIGFIGFSYFGGEPYLPSTKINEVKLQVARLKDQVDIVFVSFHWGEEYQDSPKTWQRMVAYEVINSGADFVFGHHPHWVQGFEIYQDKPIFYSLGNLVFDQNWSMATREGMVLQTIWHNNKLVGLYFNPVFMENLGQPSWQQVGYGNLAIARVENLTKSLQQTQNEILQLMNR